MSQSPPTAPFLSMRELEIRISRIQLDNHRIQGHTLPDCSILVSPGKLYKISALFLGGYAINIYKKYGFAFVSNIFMLGNHFMRGGVGC